MLLISLIRSTFMADFVPIEDQRFDLPEDIDPEVLTIFVKPMAEYLFNYLQTTGGE